MSAHHLPRQAPAVAVLLPFRDAETTLQEALDSLLNQHGVELHVYAIDDHSRDSGASIVTRRARSDSRLTLLSNEGRGLVNALSCGLHHSHEPLIARMDADDIALPTRLATQVRYLIDAPNVAAVGTQVTMFPTEHVGDGMRRYVAWQNSLLTPDDHERGLFIESPLCHPSTLLRREALRQVGGWQQRPWAEDYDLWLRLDAAGWGLAKVPEKLLRWRQHPSQMTRNDPILSIQRFTQAKAHYLASKLQDREFCIWGAGPTGKRICRALEEYGLRPERFIDVAVNKIGRTVRDIPVEPHSWVRHYDGFVLGAVGALGARTRIREFLTELGRVELRDFLFTA